MAAFRGHSCTTMRGILLGVPFWRHLLCVQVFALALFARVGTVVALTTAPDSSAAPQGLPAHVLHHQAGRIYALAFGQEGLLAVGARDHRIVLWNLTGASGPSRRELRTLEGHHGGVTALAFAPRARHGEESIEVLLSGAADNMTRAWDARTAREILAVPHPRTVFGLAVAPQQNLYTVEGRRPSKGGQEDGGFEYATACWDGVLRLFTWPHTVPKAELVGHNHGLYAVAYSPFDASLLASASADRTVRIWDATRRLLVWTLRGHKDHVTTVDWSPLEPFTLASGGWDRKFRLWELPGNEVEACRSSEQTCSRAVPPRSSGRHPQLVWRVSFSPGGQQVAACHGAVGQSPTVVVYDARSGQVIRRLGRHKDTPLAIAWSSDGSMLASAGMDKQVLVYDGFSTVNDLPQGDLDDVEEQVRWSEDLEEFRTGRPSGNNATAGEDAPDGGNVNKSDAGAGPWMPHPLGGRAAFF